MASLTSLHAASFYYFLGFSHIVVSLPSSVSSRGVSSRVVSVFQDIPFN